MKRIAAFALPALLLFALPTAVMAGNLDPEFTNGACAGASGMTDDPGDTGTVNCPEDAIIDTILRSVLNILSFVVGAASVIVMVVAGLRFITANGDAQGIASARQTIIYAIVGLIVALGAQAIVQLVYREI